ncbi:MAG: ester cyclase [Vicinamibacterales bacterium]
MMSAQYQALVRRAIAEIWNTGQLDIADLLFTPDYVNHGGLIPDLVSGPEAIKLSVVLYRRAFPALQITVEKMRTDGEIVTVRWVAANTGSRRQPTGPARPQPDRVAGVTRIRCRHGKIAESWTDWDSTGVLKHAGLTVSDITASAKPSRLQ